MNKHQTGIAPTSAKDLQTADMVFRSNPAEKGNPSLGEAGRQYL